MFDALAQGYLEKAILCMSADEEGDEMLEAWSLSVDWHTDEHGVEHPTLATCGPRAERQLALKSAAKYTQTYARETSREMLRQLVRAAHAAAAAGPAACPPHARPPAPAHRRRA